MKVVELRAELAQRGLDQKGVKAVLVQRLQAALEADGHDVVKGEQCGAPVAPLRRGKCESRGNFLPPFWMTPKQRAHGSSSSSFLSALLLWRLRSDLCVLVCVRKRVIMRCMLYMNRER